MLRGDMGKCISKVRVEMSKYKQNPDNKRLTRLGYFKNTTNNQKLWAKN